MDRADAQVEPPQDLVRQIERPVFQDIDLDAFQDPDPTFKLLIQPVDGLDLPGQPLLVQAVRNGDTAASGQ